MLSGTDVVGNLSGNDVSAPVGSGNDVSAPIDAPIGSGNDTSGTELGSVGDVANGTDVGAATPACPSATSAPRSMRILACRRGA